jgi:coenzyme F420 biosynthesis associated uncharacterized protein
MELVDWALAARVGEWVAPGGPEVPIEQARAAVEDLLRLAAAAVEPVAAASGLHAPSDGNVTVVDRPMWIASNLRGLDHILAPLAASLANRSGTGSAAGAAGAKLSAVQFGAAIGWLSGKVLGQYEAFAPPGHAPQLLLVAPNIVAAEQAMVVPARDFRLWVCVHEEAHRVQFGAVPWLRQHFADEVALFLAGADVSTAEAVQRISAVARALYGVVRGDPGASLIEAAQSPAQLEVFERLSALMSLLEGHAEWVMDAVGPQVIPSLPKLRAKLDARRGDFGAAEGLIRRLMGMDAKLRQYTEGRSFVDAVVDRVGRDGFNTVWSSPQALPTLAEIADPGAWVDRVSPGS